VVEPRRRFTTRAPMRQSDLLLSDQAQPIWMQLVCLEQVGRVCLSGAHSAQAARRIIAPRSNSPHVATSRNAPLCKGLAVGAGGFGAGLMATGAPAVVDAQRSDPAQGDLAILRFLAAEILESDLGIPYSKYGSVPGQRHLGRDRKRHVHHLSAHIRCRLVRVYLRQC
jgi:hypothetical protein